MDPPQLIYINIHITATNYKLLIFHEQDETPDTPFFLTYTQNNDNLVEEV